MDWHVSQNPMTNQSLILPKLAMGEPVSLLYFLTEDEWELLARIQVILQQSSWWICTQRGHIGVVLVS